MDKKASIVEIFGFAQLPQFNSASCAIIMAVDRASLTVLGIEHSLLNTGASGQRLNQARRCPLFVHQALLFKFS